MKSVLMLLVLGIFSVGVVGCAASAELDPQTASDREDRTVTKTTTVQPDGDREVETKVKVDR